MIKPQNHQPDKPPDILKLSDCLAKTIKIDENNVLKGMDVATHCLLAGYVARELMTRQPAWLRNALFPHGSELISAAHDVGKISPFFQEKIHQALRTAEYREGQRLGLGNPDLDKTIGGHATVSQVAVDGAGQYIPQIVGRHHGYSSIPSGPANAEIYGGSEWQKQRNELLNILKSTLQAEWPEVVSVIHSDLLAGLTSVADWISSGKLFDSIGSIGSNEENKVESLVSQSLDSAGFVLPRIRQRLSFKEIFGFAPREIQNALIESVALPGTYIMEATMGIGKTEAALYAAYKAMEENRATGIYFALPTQLTSDKMHERMNRFLSAILEDSWPHKKSLLLHSSAWLKQTEIGEEGEPGRSWFDSRKRGLLAPFAVGTIDQALMAAMNVKHGFVRTFGLAGKVVILDEVHSYDVYTGTLLDQLVEILREIHCTVIILSATLTGNRRRHLLLGKKEDRSTPADAYPLISALPKDGKLREFANAGKADSSVKVRILPSEVCAFEETLLRAERGEQVLWIENTIREAQERYKNFGARTAGMKKVECGLLHSRFLKVDRDKNEDMWVGLYGKEGGKDRQSKGRILIGTQVLEQSLDIDADFMVTRLCPTDMLFQRIGRLWRHRENDTMRPKQACRETWILSPTLDDAIANQTILGKSAKVYAPYVLCRTLEVWMGRNVVALPGQIREMLEMTYNERSEIGRMAEYKHYVEIDRERLNRLALVGVARGGNTLPESKATTRHSNVESCDVLLFRSKRHEKDGTHVSILDDTTLFLHNSPKQKGHEFWRSTSASLQRNTVRVPEYLAPRCTRQQMEWLKEYVYLGDDKESPFRAAFVQPSGELLGIDSGKALAGYKVSYDSNLGYVAIKENDSSSFE